MSNLYIKKDFPKSILIVCILFAYIYNCALFSVVTCENIAIALGALIVIYKKRNFQFSQNNYFSIQLKPILFVLVFSLVYCEMLVLLFGTDRPHETVPWYVMQLLVYGILAFIVFINLIKDIDELFRFILIVSIIQAAIVLVAVLVPSFATVIDGLYINTRVGWDYAFMRANGYPGGINCITSTGSMQLSLGIVSLVYFLNKQEKLNKTYVLLYMFLSFCATLVARTGLLIAIVGVLYLLYVSNPSKKVRIFSFSILLLLVAVFCINSFGLVDDLSEQFARLLNIKNQGLAEAFLNNYFQTTGGYDGENGIPPLSGQTILGTGITSGHSGSGIYVNGDGGFVRMYAGLGLPLAIAFYGVIFRLWINCSRSMSNTNERCIAWFWFIYMLIGEAKEPFIIFKRYPVILCAVFFYMAFRTQNNSRSNNYL